MVPKSRPKVALSVPKRRGFLVCVDSKVKSKSPSSRRTKPGRSISRSDAVQEILPVQTYLETYLRETIVHLTSDVFLLRLVCGIPESLHMLLRISYVIPAAKNSLKSSLWQKALKHSWGMPANAISKIVPEPLPSIWGRCTAVARFDVRLRLRSRDADAIWVQAGEVWHWV